jgi:ribosomal protein S18 acetylase RimI-like enzyme
VRTYVTDRLTEDQLADAASLLARLVAEGAALGWVDPPERAEVEELFRSIWAAPPGDAALAVTVDDRPRGDRNRAPDPTGGRLVGLGYWRRYERPTHRPHADVEKVAVAPEAQGRGIGRRLMTELIAAAREAGVEVLTLDLRGDNDRAAALYESLGFQRYGRIERFVAVGNRRWDKLFYALDLRRMSPTGDS